MPHWNDSCINSVFKEKGSGNKRVNYRRLKLNGNVLKVSEGATEQYIRSLTKSDQIKFDFIIRFGTNVAIFIMLKMQEKYLTNMSIKLLKTLLWKVYLWSLLQKC